jgi:hypothetical protein
MTKIARWADDGRDNQPDAAAARRSGWRSRGASPHEPPCGGDGAGDYNNQQVLHLRCVAFLCHCDSRGAARRTKRPATTHRRARDDGRPAPSRSLSRRLRGCGCCYDISLCVQFDSVRDAEWRGSPVGGMMNEFHLVTRRDALAEQQLHTFFSPAAARLFGGVLVAAFPSAAARQAARNGQARC